MRLLKQSTAVVIQFGPFVDKTDGVTLETGLVSALDHGTTGILLSKNGGTLTIRNATVTATTYDAHGCYKVTLDTTDTNTLGTLRAIYTDAATCLPVWIDFHVVPANVYDSLIAGSDVLTADVTQIGGDAQSATDLKDFADAGYDPSTNKVQGVVLVDTATTLTNDPTGVGTLLTRMGTPSNLGTGATLAANAVDIEGDTDTILSVLGQPGTNIADDIGTLQTSVNDVPTNAELATALGTADDAVLAAIAALNNLSSAQAQTAVTAALVAIGLDHLLSVSVTGTDIADNSIIAKLASKSATADWDSYINTTDALEAIRDRGDAAWGGGGGGGGGSVIE